MHSGKQRRAEIKAARLRRKAAKAARILASSSPENKPWRHVTGDGCALVEPANLAPYNSYGVPDYVQRGYYEDKPFTCMDCGAEEIWTAAQQKWWYETAKGNVWSTAKHCRQCRAKERERREEARRIHFEGLQRRGRYPRSHAPHGNAN